MKFQQHKRESGVANPELCTGRRRNTGFHAFADPEKISKSRRNNTNPTVRTGVVSKLTTRPSPWTALATLVLTTCIARAQRVVTIYTTLNLIRWRVCPIDPGYAVCEVRQKGSYLDMMESCDGSCDPGGKLSSYLIYVYLSVYVYGFLAM